MGPTRHNARSKADSSVIGMEEAQSPSTSSRTQQASFADSGPSPRASPYSRTPTQQVALRASGQTTPASKTGSPSMIKDIFQMISPFRAFSRASRSAAFGGGEQEEDQDEAVPSNAPVPRLYPSLDRNEVSIPAKDDDNMDVEQSPASEGQQLSLPPARASRSTSPRPRHSLPAPSKSLPLADNALVTPGIHKYGQFADDKLATIARPAPVTNTSPVSRNYDLLARFFAEKQRGSSSGLSEVEVGGCIRLIEESMTSGRDLQSEFEQQTAFGPAQHRDNASSRASSVMPSALPASQTMGNLFHPGPRTLPSPSSAYSFLAPRSATSSASAAVAAAAPRRRPIYLGPGMTGLSLNRRRTQAPSTRFAAISGASGLPRSATDPQLSYTMTTDSPEDQAQPGPVEVKRRRPNYTEPSIASSDSSARFDASFERRTDESSALARDIAAHASPRSSTASALVSPLKRATPAAVPAKINPPKASTRTASALQDILKDAPLIRESVQTELVNPYQSASNISRTTPSESRPIRSARVNMLTRAKAKEVASAKSHKTAADKSEPPKESVLELIERTAPKPRPSRTRVAEKEISTTKQQQTIAPTPPVPQVPKQEASKQNVVPREASADSRKLQKTEEVQRRLEALTKAKTQTHGQAALQHEQGQQKQQVPPPAQKTLPATDPMTPPKASAPSQASVSAALVPPQYTATKPKKPSPLSVAFQAPESPGSETESSQADAKVFKPVSFNKPVGEAPKPVPAPTSGFTFSMLQPRSEPAASSTTSIPTNTEKSPASNGFSFSAPTPARIPTNSSSNSDGGTLPTFSFSYDVRDASHSDADRSLKADIRAIAESALPKFTFTYEVETRPSGKEPIPTADSATPTLRVLAEPTSQDEEAETPGIDPSKVRSSGLLGEGEGEEAETTEFEIRAKFWKFDTEAKAYKDLGICVAKVKSNSDTHKRRLLARNEANGKVAVNFHIYKGIKVTREKNVCSFLGFSEEGKPTQFRVKVKTDDNAQDLQDALSAAASAI